jgi:hypothetical protein
VIFAISGNSVLAHDFEKALGAIFLRFCRYIADGAHDMSVQNLDKSWFNVGLKLIKGWGAHLSGCPGLDTLSVSKK